MKIYIYLTVLAKLNTAPKYCILLDDLFTPSLVLEETASPPIAESSFPSRSESNRLSFPIWFSESTKSLAIPQKFQNFQFPFFFFSQWPFEGDESVFQTHTSFSSKLWNCVFGENGHRDRRDVIFDIYTFLVCVCVYVWSVRAETKEGKRGNFLSSSSSSISLPSCNFFLWSHTDDRGRERKQQQHT